MLAVGLAGLAVNASPRGCPRARARESLNVRAALRHVLADLLGSVGRDRRRAARARHRAGPTPTRSPRSRSACSCSRARGRSCASRSAILLEETPRGIDAEEVGHAHGGRRWRRPRCTTCTSGRSRPGFPRCPRTSSSPGRRLPRAPPASSSDSSHERFGLDHTTLQVEHAGAETLGRHRPFVPPPLAARSAKLAPCRRWTGRPRSSPAPRAGSALATARALGPRASASPPVPGASSGSTRSARARSGCPRRHRPGELRSLRRRGP